ncbi:hypothetical protein RB195_019503 [Necator americanus]|uniref:SGNH domain-containing protein n=1 Tax=Necator americanus TaxID=51031 RepID=A0ABR1CH23_NECAM
MWISLFIQQHGLAGLPLYRNLAFRQIGCLTISYRHDSMSYFGRENLWNDLSVFPQMALFSNGVFYSYDPHTLLARLGDGSHMTPVGLELLRPLYAKILNKLLALLPN